VDEVITTVTLRVPFVSRAGASAILRADLTRAIAIVGKRNYLRHAALAALAGSLAAAAPQAAAFGPAGHRIAGLLAAPQLCAEARHEVEILGGGEPLAELGLWADAVREQPQWRQSAPWHYLNIADAPPGSAAARAAIRAFRHPPEGDVLDAIERFRAVLVDRGRPAAERADALKFLVHFVVDVHQPLHVGRAEDRGGNTIDVRYADIVVNLHRFWDTDVLELRGLGPQRYARRLAPAFAAAVAAPGSLDPRDWAAESLELRPSVYSFAAPAAGSAAVLEPEYLAAAESAAEQRLTAAAARLAAIVNGALCSAPSSLPSPASRSR
jgi:nuclease S1